MRTLPLVTLFGVLTLLACSDDPSGPDIDPPALSFAATSLTTPFFTTGSSVAPTIAWNGETGTLALASPAQGVSVDASTGVVSWDRSLPLGTNAVDVVATNSAGSSRVTLTIDVQFEGDFVGAYNGDPSVTTLVNDFEMSFESDGSATVLDVGTAQGVGTWTRSGTTITTVYSYNGGATFFTIEGEVTNSTTEATLEAFWWRGDQAVAGEESGYLEVSITP